MMYYVIPARRGSKGLPGKNRKLLRHTLDTIPQHAVPRTIVTTDDEVVAREATARGFAVVERPPELATDEASMREVLLHVVEHFHLRQDDVVTMLYLTYPERKWEDVLKAQAFREEALALSLLCRKPVATHPYLCMYPRGAQQGTLVVEHDECRRQDYQSVFEVSHFIFISQVSEIKYLRRNLYNHETVYMPLEKRVIDVDTQEDLNAYSAHNLG